MMDKTRVLIAEPEPGIARLLEVLMDRRGFATERALDGAETLRMAKDGHPDLIIMDPVMPVVEGDEVLGRLSRDPETATIPILLVATTEVLDGLENNGHVHVCKPFDGRRLNAAVDTALVAGPQAR
jgi:twitching motility two-component system response regulator PilH